MTTSAIQRPEKAASQARTALLRVDPLLFAGAIGLALCSVVTLRGAGYASYADRQALYAGVGLVLAVLISRFDYSLLREYRYVLYGVLIVLNVFVYAMPVSNGSTREIPLPLFQFEPSEFGKLLLIVSLAAFAVDRTRRLTERRAAAQVMLLGLVPAMIVIKQPDLGDGLVYVIVACSILFFMGVGWKYLTALAAVFVVAAALVLAVAPVVGVHLLQTYQKERLTTFIDPPSTCANNDTTCYQLQQGEIAIGSGGKTGRGTDATQTLYHYVPNADDDFIFSAVGEIYGFAGAAVVLALYALIVWRTLRILTEAKNLYGTLIAGGVLAMFMFQIFLNIGSTIGVMPVTGVQLPLLSYGGSSVLVTFLAIGLLQSVHVQARAAAAGKARVMLV